VYDCDIRIAVNEYNRHLYSVAGYRSLDWLFIKAMIWVETGAESPQWTTNPIQIGNPRDPGLMALLKGNEGGDLILPPTLKPRLSALAATTTPSQNIRAGIGYLLMRLANFAIKSVPDADTSTYEVVVKPGDTLDRIAIKQGSTVELLRQLNSNAHVLRPGQALKYRKAAMRKVIVGWKPITTANIAFYYNTRDVMYASKMDYVLALIRNGKAAICAF
jgi:hypothetical protein